MTSDSTVSLCHQAVCEDSYFLGFRYDTIWRSRKNSVDFWHEKRMLVLLAMHVMKEHTHDLPEAHDEEHIEVIAPPLGSVALDGAMATDETSEQPFPAIQEDTYAPASPTALDTTTGTPQHGYNRQPLTTTAFEAMYVDNWTAIYTYIRRLVGNPQESEDLTQETFAAAYRTAMASGVDPKHLKAWLYRIATNRSYDVLRRRQRITMVPFSQLDENQDDNMVPVYERTRPISDDEQFIDQLMNSDELAPALESLRPHYRIALLLWAHGFTSREIADIEVLNTTKDGAKMLVFRARQLARAYVQKQGHARP